jgi:2-keto-4-pentenoate hydratase
MKLTSILLSLFVVPAFAGTPEELLPTLVKNYLARQEVSFANTRVSEEEAEWMQNAFVEALEPALGKRVGYKVGLVTREAQQRFGTDQPVRGQLLEKMLLPNNASVPANYAVRPVIEADLIVVVKDSDINRAKTPMEVLKNLKEVVAFVELADNFLATNPPVNAHVLTASNVGARLGVLGERISVKANAEFYNALSAMEATVTDQSGAELGKGHGATILSHPLNAVLWLIEELRENDKKLKPGDLISLGSIHAFKATAGQTITVHYGGLPPGPMKVSFTLK